MHRTFKRILGMMDSKERKAFAWLLIARVVLVSFDLLGLAFLGLAVSMVSGSAIAADSYSGRVISFLNSMHLQNPYAAIAVIAVAFFIAKSVLSVGINYITAGSQAVYQTRRATGAFMGLQRSSLEFVESRKSAEMLYALGDALDDTFGRFVTAAASALGELVLIAAISVVLLLTNGWLFALVSLYFAAVGLILYQLVSRKMREHLTNFSNASIQSSAKLHDLLSNFRQLATVRDPRALVSNFETQRLLMSKSQERITLVSNLARYILEIALMLGIGALILTRTSSIAAEIPASTLAVFVAGSLRIAGSLLPLQGALATISAAKTVSDIPLGVLEDLESSLSEPNPPATPDCEPNPQCAVSMSDVSYIYKGKSKAAVSAVTFSANLGETIAIVGKSGAGKSTFADLILGVRTPTSGTCKIFGLDANLRNASDRGLVAYVPQKTELISGTIADNIALSTFKNERSEERMWAILNSLGLGPVVQGLPDGLETYVDKGFGSFSGGQIQRFGLARAMYLEPKVLVMDEATSALDDDTESMVLEALAQFASKALVFVVTHKPQTITRATRVFDVSGGRVAELPVAGAK